MTFYIYETIRRNKKKNNTNVFAIQLNQSINLFNIFSFGRPQKKRTGPFRAARLILLRHFIAFVLGQE